MICGGCGKTCARHDWGVCKECREIAGPPPKLTTRPGNSPEKVAALKLRLKEVGAKQLADEILKEKL